MTVFVLRRPDHEAINTLTGRVSEASPEALVLKLRGTKRLRGY